MVVRIGLISYIGGYKFVGNVIIYIFLNQIIKDGVWYLLVGYGIWYGRVELRYIEGIVEEIILQGKVVEEFFRGGIIQDGKIL